MAKGPRKIFPLALSPELLQAVKTEAALKEQTASSIIRQLLVERFIKLSSEPKDQTNGS